MTSERAVSGDAVAGARRPAACLAFVLSLLALAAPAWADVAPPQDNVIDGGTCGLLGGASLSALLTVMGCWLVRSRWHHRG